MTKNTDKLLLVPSGGLANRMRAVASVYELQRRTGVTLEIVWIKDWALNAPFYEIFKPTELLNIRDASWLDILLYDRPRRRNFHIPRLFQNIIFSRRIDEYEVTPLKQKAFDFDAWAGARGKKYMSCYQEFGNVDNSVYRQLFQPVDEIKNGIKTFTDKFSGHTIGFHIRRTDNAESIAKSPVSLFVEAGRKELQDNPETMIFLATDDEDVKREMAEAFGEHLLTQSGAACRSNTQGISGGLIDMYVLSHTDTIYGSAGSSFSVMASRIGNNRLVILEGGNL